MEDFKASHPREQLFAVSPYSDNYASLYKENP